MKVTRAGRNTVRIKFDLTPEGQRQVHALLDALSAKLGPAPAVPTVVPAAVLTDILADVLAGKFGQGGPPPIPSIEAEPPVNAEGSEALCEACGNFNSNAPAGKLCSSCEFPEL